MMLVKNLSIALRVEDLVITQMLNLFWTMNRLVLNLYTVLIRLLMMQENA